MNKKEYILTLLDALLDTRPLARGIRVLVSKDLLDDEAMNGLVDIFQDAIKNMTNTVQKQKMEKSVQILEKIKIAEKTAWEKKVEELAGLDKMIEEI